MESNMTRVATPDAIDDITTARRGNMTFFGILMLVRGYGISQSASYTLLNGLEFLLFAGAILFNYIFLSYRTEQAVSSFIISLIRKGQGIIQSLIRTVQEIKETLEERMPQWLKPHVESGARCFQFLATLSEPDLLVQETNPDIAQTPAPVNIVKVVQVLKSPTEPVNKKEDWKSRSCSSVSSDDSVKSEKGFLGLKHRTPPTKSPELFKNKMYMTRQILVNSIRTPQINKQ